MATAASSASFPSVGELDGTRFFNRELSWLDFDRRVLEFAGDSGVPLIERVKLCGIVASNLDEFCSVRVARLHSQVKAHTLRRYSDGRTPAETLRAVRAAILALQADQDALWLDVLKPALEDEGLRVVPVEACTASERRSLARRFQREVQPLLTPIAVGPAAPFPAVPSLALNLAAIVGEGADDRRFIRVNVPSDVPRFLVVGSATRVPLEDAILYFLPAIVGGRAESYATFRVTRDANLSINDEADDLLEEVEEQLHRRRFGEIVRLEVGRGVEPEMLAALIGELGIDGDCVVTSRAPLGLAALGELTQTTRAVWSPVTRRAFRKRAPSGLFAELRKRDLLVHHPYDAFDSSVGAFLAAAHCVSVAALKATVYRTGEPSPTVAALVDAARRGKHAVGLVELQARFDERRNIGWSRTLEDAGVEVVHGAPDLKVHAKLTMLVRRERGGLRRYVHVGTGNYHASNASSYEDLGLFTADEDIAADVADVFNAVTGRVRPAPFRKLLVGPWFLRERMVEEIARVVRGARYGETARIRIKVNALSDPELVEALYDASTAGVDVEIVTRGVCVLRPGVPGLSERISVRSVLGPFLEHSRIIEFASGDGERAWIGSADLMSRNLDERVEVMAPVEDARLRAEIAAIFDALLSDTRCAWSLDAYGRWNRIEPLPGARATSAQETLMARALDRARWGR